MKKPAVLWVAALVVVGESVALAIVAGLFVYMGVSENHAEAGLSTSLLSMGAMFTILAIGLALVGRGLLRLQRWARPAAIAWQILLALFGLSMLGSGWFLPTVSLVPSLVFLAVIFSPPALRAYETAIVNQLSSG